VSAHSFFKKAMEAREKIVEIQASFFSEQDNLGLVHEIALDINHLVALYTRSGKALRGVLVARGFEWFGGSDENAKEASFEVGAAVELLQSGFLIHDDIIDQDDVRRGNPAMHRELEQLAKNANWNNYQHVGKSLAIVAGDLCFFWMQEMVTRLRISPEVKVQLMATLAKEAIHTGVGEAGDVAISVMPLNKVKMSDVEAVNRYKTARYTVSLPLLLAAQLAGVPETFFKDIIKFGEVVGEIFQLRDDELGLFGTQEEIGKPVGSDIKEGKRTLWWCELVKRSSDNDKEKLLPLSGKQDLTVEEVEWVREKVLSSGTDAAIRERIAELKADALVLMEKIPVSTEHTAELEEAMAYIIDRRK
jgi:geranylgeranyl diphosphate synthase type I